MKNQRNPNSERPGGDTHRDWKGCRPAPVRKPGTQDGSRKEQ